MMRVRRARALIVYWKDDRMVLENYLTRIVITAAPVVINVLHVCDRWRTPNEVCSDLSQYSAQSVRQTLRSLLRHTVLVEEGTSTAQQDARLAKVWAQWLPHACFHFATKDVNTVRESQRELIARRYLAESPQPPSFKHYRKAPVYRLHSPQSSEFVRVLLKRKTHRKFAKGDVSLEAISQLLYYTWGVIDYYQTIFGKLAHKTSPSGGARHPGEVYLLAMKVSGLPAGLYHYDAKRHRLELLQKGQMRNRVAAYCSRQSFVNGASALFLMTAVFPRSMWKYRFARAYRVVILDAGHLCQTFCLTATSLGLAPFCTAALEDTLIEKDLGLDGITESVLYVAGVGCPRRRFR